jgi:hypothetical protein
MNYLLRQIGLMYRLNGLLAKTETLIEEKLAANEDSTNLLDLMNDVSQAIDTLKKTSMYTSLRLVPLIYSLQVRIL